MAIRARPAISGRYVNPVPGGTVGRTDQGVDISAPPGTPVDAITTETLVGIIRNWYRGQPFYWFKQAGGGYNYVAEQFKSGLRIGQTVRAGQPIGSVAASGTGLELGWATASGQTQAQATTGYTEGQVTPAGQSYRQQVISGGSASGGRTSLEQLWIDAGGPPGVAQTMAAISLAESGGSVSTPPSKNSNGTVDYGLWRINSSHTEFNTTELQNNPFYNAQAAVAIYRQQGLQAWTTYNTGAFRQFLGRAASASINYGGPNGGMVRPGGGTTDSSQVPQVLQDYINLRDTPRTATPNTKNPFRWWWASFSGDWQQVNAGPAGP